MPPSVRLSRFTLCFALLFALTQSASALQLGETREQLVARHGPPSDEDHARNLAMYFWDGWSATLEFHGATVGKIIYRRDWYLQEAEIASLLEANGGAAHWSEISGPTDKNRLWARDDGAAASCSRFRPLTIVFENGLDAADLPVTPKVAAPPAVSPATSTTANSPAPPDAATDTGPAPSDVPKAPQPSGRPEPIPERQPVTVAPAPHGLASALGAVALLAFAGSGFYFFKRRPRPAGARPAAASKAAPAPSIPASPPDLRKLTSDQLESFITGLFRREGYRVELSATAGSEHGLDLTVRRDAETVLVHCKNWKAAQVPASEVQDFHSAVAVAGASRGILVTTGKFTPEARRFAEGKGLELLDGQALKERLAAGPSPAKRERETVAIRDSVPAQSRISVD